MECNKGEATRAKEIAEKKFMAKEMVAAKKFALKAHNLYPGLEGINQMMATLDVYISAENKINGEADWYGILSVDPKADEEKLRKQYRKLAIMLHPDKNKSIGADGAFKFVSEAWSLLSDKSKRIVYDQKRNGRTYHKVSTVGGGSSAKSGTNGFYEFTKSTTSSVRSQKNANRSGHSSTTPSQKPKHNTFWTVCNGCKTQYEYLRVYLNHSLLCPNCHEPFFAIETPPPSNGFKSTPWNISQQQQQQQDSNHQAARKNSFNQAKNSLDTSQSNFPWGQFSRTSSASTAAQAASMVQQAYEKVKREREEAQAATKREEALRRKYHVSSKKASSTGYSGSAKRRRGIDDVSASRCGRDVATNQMGAGTGSTNLSKLTHGRTETSKINSITQPNSASDILLLNIQNLLMEKARKKIQKKINECKSESVATSSGKERNEGEKANEKIEKTFEVNERCDGNVSVQSLNTESGACSRKSFLDTSGVNKDGEILQTLLLNVPDSDFHDFDKDRTEMSFGDNQVWAAYDDNDGMPRYYAMIHSVISLTPFKMRISWLNSKMNSELGPLNWVASGFSKTCGDFIIGKNEIYNSLHSFSHKVRWSKGMRGTIRIYPRKGEVWALYRNWSPDWNEITPYEIIHKYDMVEVLEDYNEEQGVTVTPLVKVASFKTVFHQHLDLREVRKIPREELFRFSHRVPSYLLTGQEAPNAPKGCRELDPAATPPELLQIIADVKEEEILGNEDVKEEDIVDNKDFEDENTVDKLENVNDERMLQNFDKVREEGKSSTPDTVKVEVLENVPETEKDKKQMEHADSNTIC